MAGSVPRYNDCRRPGPGITAIPRSRGAIAPLTTIVTVKAKDEPAGRLIDSLPGANCQVTTISVPTARKQYHADIAGGQILG